MITKNILILGAGSAGTMMANHLRQKLDRDAWNITIVDESEIHYYQPGFLFLPFGIYDEHEIRKPIKKTLAEIIAVNSALSDRNSYAR